MRSHRLCVCWCMALLCCYEWPLISEHQNDHSDQNSVDKSFDVLQHLLTLTQSKLSFISILWMKKIWKEKFWVEFTCNYSQIVSYTTLVCNFMYTWLNCMETSFSVHWTRTIYIIYCFVSKFNFSHIKEFSVIHIGHRCTQRLILVLKVYGNY